MTSRPGAGGGRVLPVVVVVLMTACFGARAEDPTESTATASPDPLGTISIAPGQPIELGTMLADASGAGSSDGVDALRGVHLAVDFLDGTLDGDAGSLLHHPVELVGLPDACDEDEATDPPEVTVPEVVGVIGPGCGRALNAEPATVLAERGVVMISPTATEARLTEPGTRVPTFFRTAYNDLLEGALVADFAIDELGAVRGASATDAGAGEGAATSFRSRFEDAGGVVVVSGTMGRSVEAARLIRAIALGRPDVAFIAGLRPACADAARGSEALPSMRLVPVVTSVGCFDPAFIDANDSGLERYLSGPDLTRMLEDDFYRREFLPAYREQFGTAPVGPFHAQAYDATLMLLDAIDRIAERSDDGTLTIGRTALIDAVAATDGVSGISGTITCASTGDCAPDPTLAVYRVPDVPLDGGAADAEPAFSESLTLGDLVPQA